MVLSLPIAAADIDGVVMGLANDNFPDVAAMVERSRP